MIELVDKLLKLGPKKPQEQPKVRPTQKKPNLRLKGQKAEQKAKKLLQSKGYKFLTQNYQTRYGEIDLIFSQGQTIVFVEVKARSSSKFGTPTEAITPKKIQTIQKVAQHYLTAQNLHHKPARIDVVAIDTSTNQIDHLTNVTG